MTKGTSNYGREKVHKVMHEFKTGSLRSGGKKKVTSREQAIAIALASARKKSPNYGKK